MRTHLTSSLLAATLFLGCSDPGATPSDAGTDSGDAAAACPTTGTGTLSVTVTGLPAMATAVVQVTAGGTTQTVGASGSVMLPAGPFTITASRVTTTDPIVRTVHAASIDTGSGCVRDGVTSTATVTYAMVPSSNKLWTTNGSGGNGSLQGYASPTLAATGSPAATVVGTGPAGRDVAFDKDGNLWALGATTADPTLVRFAAASLGGSGAKVADRKIALPSVTCLPGADTLAFDGSGNLWVGIPCNKTVVRIPAARLETNGDVTPDVSLTGLGGVAGIAFDGTGNLWVADPGGERLRRFDAAVLGASTSTASLSIELQREPSGLLGPDRLAFDGSGNLWVSDFGANSIARLVPADLAGSGDKTLKPAIQITVGVGALLEGLAFDEGGGLWTTFGQGKLARLAPAQLGTSSGSGNPTAPDTVVSGSDLAYAKGLAFYPAPAALPLFARLP